MFHSSVFGGDFDTLRDLRIFNQKDAYNAWVELVACVQHHDCAKTEYRCMKATDAEGNKICRYRRQPLPPQAVSGPWFNEIQMPYGDDVYDLLGEMGLAEKRGEQWEMAKCMLAGKWHYLSRRNEFFLATIPLLSAICQSSTNVDMCDRKFQVSYLIKYVSGKEEHQLVDVSGTRVESEIKVITEDHAHEKITHCKNLLDNKLKVSKSHLGREVSLCEIVWFNLGFCYTYCTADFVHASMLPLENRVGVHRAHKHSQFLYDATNDIILPVQERVLSGLPAWRQFTDAQVMHVEDYIKSPYLLDAASSFNIRPPELRCFDDFQVYCECFAIVRTQKTVCSTDVGAQPWFDGVSRLVKLRAGSVNKALGFVSAKAASGHPAAMEMLQHVFTPISQGSPSFLHTFVQAGPLREIISVVSFVKPWDRTNFLVHLCKSLGCYECESDLFLDGNIKQAFVKAGLLNSVDQVSRAELMAILRRYIEQDLLFHPISARQFGRYVKAASATLHDLFINNVLGDYSPCITDIMLKERASDTEKQEEIARRNALVNALFDDPAIGDSLPLALKSQQTCERIAYVPDIAQIDGISDAAIAEQRSALKLCIDAVGKFVRPTCCGVRFPCLVGRPGSGKSHVLKLAVAYCLCKGLHVQMMSLTSERARKVGGNHLHVVFPLPVTNSRVSFSQDIVLRCTKRLERDLSKSTLLKRTDVFIF
jgi:hypothetical protein